jgi:hypothetical protein
MADFCEQCAFELLDIVSRAGFGDLAGLAAPGQQVYVLCEGCGPALVDHLGVCQGGCHTNTHSGAQADAVAARAAMLLGADQEPS